MSSKDRTGQQLGNYLLVRLIGSGGFSEVYLAEHIHLRTLAAIKVFYALLNDEEIHYFRSEGRVFATLKHPNIAPTLDFGVEDKTPFIVMGYAPNGTLRQRHPKGTSVPLETVVSYVKQIASALQYAHDHKILHRDIKPENMLLSSSGEILLSDFGIQTLARSTRTQSIQEVGGTVAYMAPEQFEGHPNRTSDQYSLGIVVYEWLSGDRPFYGSFLEIAVKQHVTSAPSLREKVPSLPSEVDEVVTIALAKESTQRFASVRAFATALEQAAGMSSPSSRIISPEASGISGAHSPSQITLNQSKASSYESGYSYPPSPGILNPYTPQSDSYPSYDTHMTQAPYTLTPPAPPAPEVPHNRKVVFQRRRILIGVVGLMGLAVAEIVAAALSSKNGSSGRPASTPTPSPLPKNITYLGHSNEVDSVKWSPDGKFLASGSRDDTVKVWNSVTAQTLLTYSKFHNWVFDVAWSPDGRRIAAAGADGTVQIWDATTGSNIFRYTGHTAGVFAVGWSLDGKRIASASADKTVRVWDAVAGENAHIYDSHSAEVTAVAWSPDGMFIASGSADKTVQVWDALTGVNAHIYDNHSAGVTAVAWSPDGMFIASGSADKTVRVWDAMTLGKTFTFTYTEHLDQVNTVAWSPDSKLLASGSADRTVRVWNTTGTLMVYRGHADWVDKVAWSPDGRRIASASADKTVQVWEATGR